MSIKIDWIKKWLGREKSWSRLQNYTVTVPPGKWHVSQVVRVRTISKIWVVVIPAVISSIIVTIGYQILRAGCRL